eukprot:TRINITY_DN62470_c0_g1_i1.p1 TRINITY_DN62470_c0_g1~~TRINITY_DN62470_c0_g1_i1.p1  ORF type:complete len:305 (-),score=55.35 TRINITY_DN62470_c0_g1_i1:95-1009(-)
MVRRFLKETVCVATAAPVLSRHARRRRIWTCAQPVRNKKTLVIGPEKGQAENEGSTIAVPIVVFLHGFGSRGARLAAAWLPELEARLGRHKFGQVRWVFPTAPLRPITCYSGKTMRGWYDYLSDRRCSEGPVEETISEEDVRATRRWLADFLASQRRTVGGSSEPLVLVGHSQGGCMAVDYAALAPFSGAEVPSAVFCSRGHALGTTLCELGKHASRMTSARAPPQAQSETLPLLAHHGSDDEYIPVELTKQSFAALSKASNALVTAPALKVELEVQPKFRHMEPSSREFDRMAALLDRICCTG